MTIKFHCPRCNKLSAAGGVLIGLGLLAYVYSFCVPAFNTNEPGTETMWGILAFIMGFFGLFQLQTTWLANPAWCAGLICAGRRKWKAATVCGILATGFALVALLIYDPSAAPAHHGCTSLSGGETIRLTQLLPGYCCWLASMVIFLSGSTLKLLFSPGRRQTQPSPAQGVTLPAQDQPIQARPAGRAERTWRWWQQKPWGGKSGRRRDDVVGGCRLRVDARDERQRPGDRRRDRCREADCGD